MTDMQWLRLAERAVDALERQAVATEKMAVQYSQQQVVEPYDLASQCPGNNDGAHVVPIGVIRCLHCGYKPAGMRDDEGCTCATFPSDPDDPSTATAVEYDGDCLVHGRG